MTTVRGHTQGAKKKKVERNVAAGLYGNKHIKTIKSTLPARITGATLRKSGILCI